MNAAVLDAGALIALERGSQRMLALLVVLTRDQRQAYVPAGVVAQVWRGSARQHHLARLLATDAVSADTMDEATARAVGVLLGRSGASDVVDGHVALLGLRTRGTVLTSDAEDIRRIAPGLDIVPV